MLMLSALFPPLSLFVQVVIKFLRTMQKHGYIGDFELIDDHRSGKIVVELNGRLNKAGCISPRFDIQVIKLNPSI